MNMLMSLYVKISMPNKRVANLIEKLSLWGQLVHTQVKSSQILCDFFIYFIYLFFFSINFGYLENLYGST